MTDSSLSLLVVGVKWPPETFIRRRLEGLAARSGSVTVATRLPWRRANATLPGVSLVRLSHCDDPAVLIVLRLIWDGLALLVQAAYRWPLVIKAVRRQSPSTLMAAFAKLRAYLPLARLHPAVVHFEWNSAAMDYSPLFDVWKCPVVISCRGSQINVRPHVPENQAFVQGLFDTFTRATAVHCVSKAIRDEAVQFALDPRKAVVIRPAVDPDFFKPGDKKDHDEVFKIVTTGSLIWRKGYEYALLAVRQLAESGVAVRFEIIGEGPEYQRTLYTIHDLGLEGRVHLHGRLTPEQIRDRLQQADVFLLSSLSEGISNAVLEAMACGLPVVTSDCDGMREAISDGVEGFVVPVRQPEAITAALLRFAYDPELRRRMGSAGRKRVLQQFNLADQVDKFIALYQTVSAATIPSCDNRSNNSGGRITNPVSIDEESLSI